MKIFISIPNYGDSQLQYLHQIITEFKSYKNYDVTIYVHTTCDVDINVDKLILYNDNIKDELTNKHRAEMCSMVSQPYDLYMYVENDILIKEEAIDCFVKYSKLLPINHCLGFLRFEKRHIGDALYLPDMHPNWPTIISNTNNYFTINNQHQGCYILTKEQLQYVINNSDYTRYHTGCEHNASDIFYGFNNNGCIHKVYSKDINDLKRCLIHHLSNRFCTIKDNPIWQYNPGPLTFDNLLELIY